MSVVEPFAFSSLLPLHGVVFTLRFTAPARLRFFHQAALTALLRHLVEPAPDYDRLLTLDAPEAGRLDYGAGEEYRFALLSLADGEDLLRRAWAGLAGLPATAPVRDGAVPFRDNLVLAGARDLFTGAAVGSVGDLSAYDAAALDAEAALWGQGPFLWRWRSPVRLLRGREERGAAAGEARFCRSPAQVEAGLLFDRVYDGCADLLRRRGVPCTPRGPAPGVRIGRGELFWVDHEYRGAEGPARTMGGMVGALELVPEAPLPPEPRRLLVLGQYLGTGQMRAFGWGRYRLESPDGEYTAVHPEPARPLLDRVVATDNLLAAHEIIRANRQPPAPVFPDDDSGLPDEAEPPLERLERLAERLRSGRYAPPPLRGVVMTDPDGETRGLAIAPFLDSVAQRAMAQVLAPALDDLMAAGSHGFRAGRSRHSARAAIEAAYREGFRWVYESDVADFFDSIAWDRLEARIAALFGDDPVVPLTLDWMRAPVEFEGELIARRAGLPQGSPLSPALANLMLDDFDADLETAGFRLIRYADDFVVLCKAPEQARAAARAVERSLAEAGLAVNPDKTRTVSFEQGFRYLGFLFVGGLALDVSGERRRAGEPAPKSPASGWLARLGRRQPKTILPDGRFGAPEPAPPPPAPASPRGIGTLDDAGATLFVTGPWASISTHQGRLRVERDGATVLERSWRQLGSLVLIGPHHLSTPALRTALEENVAVHFAARSGRYQGTAWNGAPGPWGTGLWLRQEALFADPARCLPAMKALVDARIRHQREVLRQREGGPEWPELRAGFDRLLEELPAAADREVCNGIEGRAGRFYFAGLRTLVPPEYGFDGRNRQPPEDPYNALLSLGYTILHCHADTALRAAGLLPWRGFYHGSHGRHAALASDLIEPFRHVVERAALTALTRRLLAPAAFTRSAEDGCRLDDTGRRTYLEWLGERFETPTQSLYGTGEKNLLGHLHEQNLALIAWIRGETPEFQPWRMR